MRKEKERYARFLNFAHGGSMDGSEKEDIMFVKHPKFAVVLLAHGTKEPEASRSVHGYAQELSRSTGLRVEPCLREFIEPSVPTVIEGLNREGVERVFVLPFFLFKSGHVTRDIEEDIDQERKKYPHIQFFIGEPLGEDVLLDALLRKRLKEGLKAHPECGVSFS